eukprot:3386272-Prymnesium_polylepis.1
MQTEHRMLHHTLDADPDDPTRFVWSSFKTSDQFIEHLDNEANDEYLRHHRRLGGGNFSIQIYGTPSARLL